MDLVNYYIVLLAFRLLVIVEVSLLAIRLLAIVVVVDLIGISLYLAFTRKLLIETLLAELVLLLLLALLLFISI